MTGKGAGEAPATLAVKVVPRASRDEVAGISEGIVRIRLAAPAVEGRANEALVRFLAGALGVPRANVVIASGTTGRRKIVRISGVTRDAALARLLPGGRAPRGAP